MSRNWAYLSNYLIYSSMAVYTLSFFAHAIETAWAVRVTTEDSKQTLDYKRTEKVARIATAMMILGFLLLVAGVIARGVSAGRVPEQRAPRLPATGRICACSGRTAPSGHGGVKSERRTSARTARQHHGRREGRRSNDPSDRTEQCQGGRDVRCAR